MLFTGEELRTWQPTTNRVPTKFRRPQRQYVCLDPRAPGEQEREHSGCPEEHTVPMIAESAGWILQHHVAQKPRYAIF